MSLRGSVALHANEATFCFVFLYTYLSSSFESLSRTLFREGVPSFAERRSNLFLNQNYKSEGCFGRKAVLAMTSLYFK